MKSILLEGPTGGGADELQRELGLLGYALVQPQRPLPTCLAPAHIVAPWALPERRAVGKHLHLAALQRSKCSLDVYAAAEEALRAARIQVVLCVPPWQAAVDAWLASEGKGFSDSSNMYLDYKNEYRFYLSAWHSHTRSILRYDRTVYSAESFARALRDLEYGC